MVLCLNFGKPYHALTIFNDIFCCQPIKLSRQGKESIFSQPTLFLCHSNAFRYMTFGPPLLSKAFTVFTVVEILIPK